jgi:4-alpha-glucanotransferase
MTDTATRQILPLGRQAGVCLHITSLPGPYGIGEIGQHALQFVDTMKKMQLGVWQFLPTGPTAFADSPYQPLSTFAGNELLIDVGDLISKGLLSKDEASELTTLPCNVVDYGALIPVKNRILRLASARFADKSDAALAVAYQEFVHENNDRWLHDYALFRILKSQHGDRPWPDWQPEYVHRDKKALRRIEGSKASAIEAIKIIQFLFHHQWQQLHDYARDQGVRLFGDMPIYVALDSADAWTSPELLQIDGNGQPAYVAGVPPDYFSEDGQLWGNPLYAWENHAANGYQWWIDRLRAAAELVDIVRIDHFRGLEAYWAVPAGSDTARNGTWHEGPGDAIFDAMRHALGDLPIVAEDLGLISPECEALRDRNQIPGMKVLQFAITDDRFELSDVAENCVCYTGTHDNDTTVGWYNGSPDDIRSDTEIERIRQATLEITAGTPETIHMDLVRAAFSTDASLAIAPLQDYLGLGSEARMNTPGTSENNWRWRLDATRLTDSVCNQITKMVQASGRALQN